LSRLAANAAIASLYLSGSGRCSDPETVESSCCYFPFLFEKHPFDRSVCSRPIQNKRFERFILRFRWLKAASGTVCRSTSPQLQRCFWNRLKTSLFPIISFLTFRFPVLYTVYSNGLAVLYLSHSKEL